MGEWGGRDRGLLFSQVYWSGVGQQVVQRGFLPGSREALDDIPKVLGNDEDPPSQQVKYPSIGSRGSLGPDEHQIFQGHRNNTIRSLDNSKGSALLGTVLRRFLALPAAPLLLSICARGRI